MKTAVYPGSFDPVTYGHIDIIDRASRLFDRVIVAVLNNPSKTPLFNTDERLDMLLTATREIKNVEVDCFSGLLIDYVEKKEATTVVKGLRAVSDFESELQMALMNRKLNRNVETIFMMTSSRYSFLSSSLVKEVAKLGGCVKDLVPEYVNDQLMKKFEKQF
ncbi:MAG: Phosphopantetheine adenylyltransferase [Firmicutes bacterium]|nr:Phosphopantetheine adenylyltransferase [Bacillota bacterium]MDI6707326.1 pantetheine-phosphate adenylyltransferase [Bacillota bacterium]